MVRNIFIATISLFFCFSVQANEVEKEDGERLILNLVGTGKMYESIGFQGAYLVLGIIALSFTLISVFTLSGPGPFSLLRRRESVAL